MMFRVLAMPLVSLLSLSLSAVPFLSQNTPTKIYVETFLISGTQTLDTAELDKISAHFVGVTFDETVEELQERLQVQFQDKGYFQVKIEKFEVKVLDPIAKPKRVGVEARVAEGPLSRLSLIEFVGNHAVDAGTLRAKFPVKNGPFSSALRSAAGWGRFATCISRKVT